MPRLPLLCVVALSVLWTPAAGSHSAVRQFAWRPIHATPLELFARVDAELARLHAEAKAAGRGLWAGKNPAPPWEWRKRQADERAADSGRINVAH